ncbi:HD family phosphohydrolase [Cyanobium sp. Morenito 9A2]|uniref:HD family phosphohydrolase n=1 Tax=Cyanobium sp. Morenito 9A2 TaxID=2823718 RepID=UPI0020CE7C5D|nr:HD family phosphohydrolase [Cyanobium sp. Morenito 9A2]MCP9850052.1 GAF domain-containing protein [Cyanobium sp. Morenito 9A2]
MTETAFPASASTGTRDQTLVEILNIAAALSGAGDLRTLLHLILTKSRQLTGSDAGSIFLVERVDQRKDPGGVDKLWFAVSQNASLATDSAQFGRQEDIQQELSNLRFPLTSERLVGWSALTGEVLNIPDAYSLDPALPYRFDSKVDKELGYRAVSMLTVPMRSTSGETVGVMQLINRKIDPAAVITAETAQALVRPFDAFDQTLIQALASQAAVCVERTQLLEAQRQLIDSMITLLAGAIDAKSPYTGGHCARVPELALMLARAAEEAKEGPLAGFAFKGEEEWREFRIGAWLHDCGKITTPEYVVDKATKLETNYNRIHEVRTRFEVLLRDARIAWFEGVLGGGDREMLNRLYREREVELQEQFSFVAECNLGAEFMGPEKVERLRSIGAQTWKRHFDSSLGLAWEELSRHTQLLQTLPVEESLLADKVCHIIQREQNQIPEERYGFKMEVPEHLYNLGEIHNLSVCRGTLTDEERYKINEHIVQTIIMLEGLPFPANLSRVSEYAGTHHETLDGKGYPRKLSAAELSVPSRIMAIADIFEALTASDRPYKKAKTLSQSLRILSGFRDREHIDADLFELFLRSGIYQSYAELYLLPEQIDEVDVDSLLRPTTRGGV